MIVHEGRVTLADRDESVYVYLPVKVPAGTQRMDVSYRFDDGSILDLGLFDPSLTPFPSRSGFRGWSGSARRHVFVAAGSATPGYIAGPAGEPLPAGTWQVVLGLAQVAAEGCDYRVEIEFDRPTRDEATGKGPARWYRGDLQSHTHHSDARGSLDELLVEAKHRGLEFLAVTDHNTVSHHGPLRERSGPDLLLIPGEEITTYKGHANVWGLSGWADFRVEKPADLDLLVEQITARGGVFSVNHPKVTPNCLGCDWEYHVPQGTTGFEAWQGAWPLRNWDSLQRYDALLAAGRVLALVGGSDRHHPGAPHSDPVAFQLGSPTTWLYLEEPSVSAVLDAIRSGRAFVTEGPTGPTAELRVGSAVMGGTVPGGKSVEVTVRVVGAAGDLLRYISSEGVEREVVVGSDEVEDSWQWLPRGTFLRAELVARASLPGLTAEAEALLAGGRLPPYLSLDEMLAHPWRRALTNPVYVR